VTYTYLDTDGLTTLTAYEPVCVRSTTEAAALAEVTTATTRFRDAVDATRTMTLVLTTADV
jgi:hypothetical protein